MLTLSRQFWKGGNVLAEAFLASLSWHTVGQDMFEHGSWSLSVLGSPSMSGVARSLDTVPTPWMLNAKGRAYTGQPLGHPPCHSTVDPSRVLPASTPKAIHLLLVLLDFRGSVVSPLTCLVPVRCPWVFSTLLMRKAFQAPDHSRSQSLKPLSLSYLGCSYS